MYELIQNADDLDYSNIWSLREQPKLHFILTREHLIIDNNENGFKVANVQALCAISESSKKINAGDESIGEKGIGFKSIFAIAQEVHVQSGHWSFGFENRREDPLSIIIPKLMPHQDLPPGIQTRIKIRYHESSRDRIVEDLRGLSHGALMFLRNISHLTISFDPQAAVNEPQRSFSMRQESLGSITCLETRVGGLSGNATARSRYQVHRRSFTMPADEDHRSTTTEVQLAFPIAVEARDPCISPEGEHVYAFLPMHKKPEFPVSVAYAHSSGMANMYQSSSSSKLTSSQIIAASTLCHVRGTTLYGDMSPKRSSAASANSLALVSRRTGFSTCLVLPVILSGRRSQKILMHCYRHRMSYSALSMAVLLHPRCWSSCQIVSFTMGSLC